jgi:CO/xanthine dehydrogenase Mo-binding subunit
VGIDGSITIATAAAELGQGLGTTLAMIVSEALGGLALSEFRYVDNDTSLAPDGGITGASRQTTASGMAAFLAADELKTRLMVIGGELLDANPHSLHWEAGNLVNAERPGHKISLREMALEAKRIGVDLSVQSCYVAPATTTMDEETGQGYPVNSYSYATAIAEVEVDTETGQVQVLKLTSVHDSGRIINPAGAEAQVEGGLIMGLGFALMEEFVAQAGIPITQGFTEYLLPTSVETPEIKVYFVDDHVGIGPFGAKGLAEVPMVVAAPAIMNAIYNATGARVTDLPATPERVWRALADKSDT